MKNGGIEERTFSRLTKSKHCKAIERGRIPKRKEISGHSSKV